MSLLKKIEIEEHSLYELNEKLEDLRNEYHRKVNHRKKLFLAVVNEDGELSQDEVNDIEFKIEIVRKKVNELEIKILNTEKPS